MNDKSVTVWMVRRPEEDFEYRAMCEVIRQVEELSRRMTNILDWHILCNVMILGREIDLVLATTSAFITIELKHVPKNATVRTTQNQWQKCFPDGAEVPFKKLPLEQAKVQRANCKKWVSLALNLNRVQKDQFFRSIIAISPSTPPNGSYDDFYGFQEKNIVACRVGEIGEVIARFLKECSWQPVDKDLLNKVLAHRLGMAKAIWVNELPVPAPIVDIVDEDATHEAQLKAINLKLAKAQSQLTETEKIAECEKARVVQLQQELLNAQQLLVKSNEQLRDTQKALSNQRHSLEILKGEEKSPTNEEIQLKARIKALQEQCSALTAEKTKAESAAQKAAARYEELVADEKSRADDLQRLNVANTREVAQLRQKLANAQQMLAKSNEQLCDTQKALSVQKHSLAMLKESKALSVDEEKKLKARIEALQGQCQALVNEKVKAEGVAQKAAARYEELIAEQRQKEEAIIQALHGKLVPENKPSEPIYGSSGLPLQQQFTAGLISGALWDGVSKESPLLDWAKALCTFQVDSPCNFSTFDTDETLELQLVTVLSNLVSRGIPTLVSPEIDLFLSKRTNLLQQVNQNGVFSVELVGEDVEKQLMECIEAMQVAGFVPSKCELWETKRSFFQLFYQPLLTGRVQKSMLEAYRCGNIAINGQTIRVLAIEHDVTGVAIALQDLEMMMRHLFALAGLPEAKVPHFEVETIALSPAPKCFYEEVLCRQLGEELDVDYEVRLETAFFKQEDVLELERIPSQLSIKITSSIADVENRLITGSNIQYLSLGERGSDGLFNENLDVVQHLKYFLKLLFRKLEFRPGQIPILNRALRLLPVIGLLPTGGGKSLTYQLAALLQPGVCLVVDPLKTLMFDQELGLNQNGIDTCVAFNSDLKGADTELWLGRLERGCLKFIFVAPERLQVPSFRARLQAMSVVETWFSYGVIDEVHCVSEWGHDFRTSYLHLGRNLYNFVKTKNGTPLPLFGLTATASFDVLADVERVLSGENAYQLDSEVLVRYEHTNRLELQYLIYEIKNKNVNDNKYTAWDLKLSFAAKDDLLNNVDNALKVCQREENLARIYDRFCEREGIMLGSDQDRNIRSQDIKLPLSPIFSMENNLEGDVTYSSSVLFFCPTVKGFYKNGVYPLLEKLKTNYQSKLPRDAIGAFASKDKQGGVASSNRDVQVAFKENKILLMAATKAFGMGLDKPNIRCVIELCYPGSLEAFVQEAGRAGRDRKLALCMVLYSEFEALDRNQNEYFHKQSFVGVPRERIAMHYLWQAPLFVNPENEQVVRLVDVVKQGCGPRCIIHLPLDDFEDEKYEPTWEKENGILRKAWERYDQTHVGGANSFPTAKDKQDRYIIDRTLIRKVIFRLTAIGLVDDVLEDYARNRLILHMTLKSEGGYYASLQSFLERYYMPNDAATIVDGWKKQAEKRTEVIDCMWRITDFIYDKVAKKRARAITDMQDFCRCGLSIRYGKTWLERNEALKDYLYYYFNSKYARSGYQNERGEEYSLYDDTEGAKRSDMEIVWKYMSVVDQEQLGSSESPKDNIKHLQGAVRLLRRAVIDRNPALALLDAFCMLMILPPDNEESERVLFSALFNDGFDVIFSTSSKKDAILYLQTYFEKLEQYGALLSSKHLSILKMSLQAKLLYQSWDEVIQCKLSTIHPFLQNTNNEVN